MLESWHIDPHARCACAQSRLRNFPRAADHNRETFLDSAVHYRAAAAHTQERAGICTPLLVHTAVRMHFGLHVTALAILRRGLCGRGLARPRHPSHFTGSLPCRRRRTF